MKSDHDTEGNRAGADDSLATDSETTGMEVDTRGHHSAEAATMTDEEVQEVTMESDDDANEDTSSSASASAATAEDLLFCLRRQLCQSDPLAPGRMELTDNERHWALNIKSAFQRTPDLQPLSDFVYAQLAIVDRFDVLSAMARIRRLQQWRQQYAIQDTIVDGQHFFQALILRLFPGLFLSVSYNPNEGCYDLIQDITKYEEKVVISSPANDQIWVAGCYYLLHALTPDMESIRQGHNLLYEGEGYDVNILEDMWSDFREVYPCRFRSIHNLQQGVLSILVASTEQSSLSPMESNLKSILCNTATQENAQERLLRDLKCALQRRYDNEASFSLP